MQENRRLFLRRLVKVSAVAAAVDITTTTATKSTLATNLRGRVRGLFGRRRNCSTC